MSTRSSLAYKEFERKFTIHVYHEMMDSEYYLESDDGKVLLPTKELAEKIAAVINKEGKEVTKFQNK